jgi:hypothetical protein
MWGMADMMPKALAVACGDILAFSWDGMAKHNLFQDTSSKPARLWRACAGSVMGYLLRVLPALAGTCTAHVHCCSCAGSWAVGAITCHAPPPPLADSCTPDTTKGNFLAGGAMGSTSGNAMWTAPGVPGTYVFKCTLGNMCTIRCAPAVLAPA